MKKYLLYLAAVLGLQNLASAVENEDSIPIRIYDDVIFYDGYRMKDNPDSLLQDGVTRHSCSLYSRPLTDEQLDALGEKLTLNV